METALALGAEAWAEQNLGGAPLGDERRGERLVRMGAQLAQVSHGVLPQTFRAWPDLKGAYRFLGNAAVTAAAIQRPHLDWTRQACLEQGTVLLISDTTDLNFTRAKAVKGLGWTGNTEERGLLVHTTLAVRVERWARDGTPQLNLLGLFDQEVWTRTHPPRQQQEGQWQRLQRTRESQRWGRAIFASGGPPAWAEWVHVADRESDIYEVLLGCRETGTSQVIRACWPRKVDGARGGLLQAARHAAIKGQTELALRARPGQPARTAVLTIRAATLTLRAPARPEGRGTPFTVNVVAVVEENPPAGVKGLDWVLVTNLPVHDLEACLRVVRIYEARWLIEEYHKALKTGLGVEQSQLETAHALRNLLALLAIVGVRLVRLKLLGRSDPRRELGADDFPADGIALLEKVYGRPPEGWTARQVLRHLARQGGFLARRGDGEPGWLTLWRGWQRFSAMLYGARLLKGA
jgi:hypothetical protein